MVAVVIAGVAPVERYTKRRQFSFRVEGGMAADMGKGGSWSVLIPASGCKTQPLHRSRNPFPPHGNRIRADVHNLPANSSTLEIAN